MDRDTKILLAGRAAAANSVAMITLSSLIVHTLKPDNGVQFIEFTDIVADIMKEGFAHKVDEKAWKNLADRLKNLVKQDTRF